MSELKHTPLRHRMLREIADDVYGYFRRDPADQDGTRAQFRHRRRNLSAAEARCLGEFDSNSALSFHQARSYSTAQSVDLNSYGSALLAEWDEKHGAVSL